MKVRWVEWIDPFGPNNEPAYHRVPETTAVACARDYVAKNPDKCRKDFKYENDEQALEDFMTVHWAWFVEDDRDENGKRPEEKEDASKVSHA